jgi:peptidoglycan hydrolase CwlO-like protein
MKQKALPILTCVLAILAVIFLVTTISGNNKNGQLAADNAGLTEQVNQMTAGVQELTAQVAELTAAGEEKENQIADLSAAAETAAGEITRLTSEAEEKAGLRCTGPAHNKRRNCIRCKQANAAFRWP